MHSKRFKDDSVTQKCMWCVILIVVLSVSLAVPARAAGALTALIIIAAATTSAAIAVIVGVTAAHRRRKILITGCVVSGDQGMTATDEEDRKLYVLSGNMTGIKPGDRMRLQGKKVKSNGSGKTLVWKTKEVIKDYGVCQPSL
jgi:hypothetical protein